MRDRDKQWLDDEEVIRPLEVEVERAGGQTAFARLSGLNRNYLNKFLKDYGRSPSASDAAQAAAGIYPGVSTALAKTLTDGRQKKPRRGKCRGQAEEYCCPHAGSVRSESTRSTISAAIPPNEGGARQRFGCPADVRLLA